MAICIWDIATTVLVCNNNLWILQVFDDHCSIIFCLAFMVNSVLNPWDDLLLTKSWKQKEKKNTSKGRSQ